MYFRFTDPDTIRGQFGLTDTRNASHGSDSVLTADKEKTDSVYLMGPFVVTGSVVLGKPKRIRN